MHDAIEHVEVQGAQVLEHSHVKCSQKYRVQYMQREGGERFDVMHDGDNTTDVVM